MRSCPNATPTTPTREELARYMPLVHGIVARVMRKVPPNALREDLVSAGALGLVSALRRNTERGAAIVRFDDLSAGQAGAFADESVGTPEEQAGQRLDRRILQHALGRLPEREGNIVAWHYFEDVSFKSIATRLGVSEPRVSQLHSRAIGLLRTRMTDQSSAEAA
jgi:RNA polymerase sigma factor FliA